MSKDKEEKPKKNDFKAFLRKRAPIYLGIMGLFFNFHSSWFNKRRFRK